MSSNTKLPEGVERRFHETKFEVRESEGEPKRIVGYAAVFGKRSVNLGFSEKFPFFEIIQPGAFENVLKDDVRAVIDHKGGLQTLGRTKSGTLKISEDEIGLRFELETPDTQAGRDIMTLIQRGDIDQASFKFRVKDDGDEFTDEDDGKTTVRTIKKGGIAELLDVSPVTFPAYQDTIVQSRSIENYISAKRQRPNVALRRARELRLALTERKYK